MVDSLPATKSRSPGVRRPRAEDAASAADPLGCWILGVRVILVVLFVAVLDMVFKPGLRPARHRPPADLVNPAVT
jgi:hypothetical protein